jgi:hypothetical protein
MICVRGKILKVNVVPTYPIEKFREISRIQSSGGKRFVFEEDKNFQRWERTHLLAAGRKYSDSQWSETTDSSMFGGIK